MLKCNSHCCQGREYFHHSRKSPGFPARWLPVPNPSLPQGPPLSWFLSPQLSFVYFWASVSAFEAWFWASPVWLNVLLGLFRVLSPVFFWWPHSSCDGHLFLAWGFIFPPVLATILVVRYPSYSRSSFLVGDLWFCFYWETHRAESWGPLLLLGSGFRWWEQSRLPPEPRSPWAFLASSDSSSCPVGTVCPPSSILLTTSDTEWLSMCLLVTAVQIGFLSCYYHSFCFLFWGCRCLCVFCQKCLWGIFSHHFGLPISMPCDVCTEMFSVLIKSPLTLFP